MDKPADPATLFAEVYQSFLDVLVLHGRKPRNNILRFDNGKLATLASQKILFGYRRHLETLPPQPRGSIRRRRGSTRSVPIHAREW